MKFLKFIKRLITGSREPRPDLKLCKHCGHRIETWCVGYPEAHCYCEESIEDSYGDKLSDHISRGRYLDLK